MDSLAQEQNFGAPIIFTRLGESSTVLSSMRSLTGVQIQASSA